MAQVNLVNIVLLKLDDLEPLHTKYQMTIFRLERI